MLLDRVARAVARAGVAAIGAEPFQQILGGLGVFQKQRLGGRALLEAFSQLPWLRAVSDKVATATASTTWTVNVRTTDGKAVRDRRVQAAGLAVRTKLLQRLADQGDLRQLDNHPLLDFLDGGENDQLEGLSTRTLTQIYLDLLGAGGWLLARNPLGMPIAPFPFPATWVLRRPTISNPNYIINFPTQPAMTIAAEDVVFFAHPDPADPYRAFSGLGMALGDDLETDEYAAKHTKDFFRNRALPHVLVTGLGVDKGERERVEQKWLQKTQGPGKAWLPLFLNRDIKTQVISQSFQNMQLTELRKFERDLVLQVYGMPPEIFGIIENSNRSTIDAADYLMSRYVVVPRLEFQRAVLQRRLVAQFDERIILNYESPIQEDRQYELEVLKAVPFASQLNEWRKRAGLEPLDDTKGKVYAIPYTLRIVNELTPEDQQAADAVSATPGQVQDPTLPGKRLGRKADDDLPDRVADAVDPKVLAAKGRPAIKGAIEAFGQKVLVELGTDISFSMADPLVIAYLQRWSSTRIAGLVNETTRQQLRETLAEGVGAGEATRDLAKRIQAVFDVATTARAKVIARTEITPASNFGTLVAMHQAGVEQKGWLSTKDDRVRDTHAELDGTIVGINDDFHSSSGAEAPYPGAFGVPEEDINCRCGLVLASALKSRDIRTGLWKALEADRRPFERQLEDAMAAGFAVQRAAALTALTHGSGRAAA